MPDLQSPNADGGSVRSHLPPTIYGNPDAGCVDFLGFGPRFPGLRGTAGCSDTSCRYGTRVNELTKTAKIGNPRVSDCSRGKRPQTYLETNQGSKTYRSSVAVDGDSTSMHEFTSLNGVPGEPDFFSGCLKRGRLRTMQTDAHQSDGLHRQTEYLVEGSDEYREMICELNPAKRNQRRSAISLSSPTRSIQARRQTPLTHGNTFACRRGIQSGNQT
ncbi:MAG: hypothetical protein AAFN70_03430, partial [Planctomycetota bacterium]